MCPFVNIPLENGPKIVDKYFLLASLIKILLCLASILLTPPVCHHAQG